MKIIVDTCIWSLALRRKKSENEILIDALTNLIKDVRVQMIGPIRQELLTGIRTVEQFEKVKNYLSAFPDLDIQTKDYELAAHFSNECRNRGIQGSNTDFLICALSSGYKMPIFTVDKDFENFKKILPIRFMLSASSNLVKYSIKKVAL